MQGQLDALDLLAAAGPMIAPPSHPVSTMLPRLTASGRI